MYAQAQQIALWAVNRLKLVLPGMDGNQSRRARSILVMPRAKGQDEPMRIWLGAAVDMVDAHDWLVALIQMASDATERGHHAVESLLVCRGRDSLHAA